MYSYLNLESTKTSFFLPVNERGLYSYLNLESTKTGEYKDINPDKLYSYLNLESTKTYLPFEIPDVGCTVT